MCCCFIYLVLRLTTGQCLNNHLGRQCSTISERPSWTRIIVSIWNFQASLRTSDFSSLDPSLRTQTLRELSLGISLWQDFVTTKSSYWHIAIFQDILQFADSDSISSYYVDRRSGLPPGMASQTAAWHGWRGIHHLCGKEHPETEGWDEWAIPFFFSFFLGTCFPQLLKAFMLTISHVAYEGFVAPYASSSKEPDICIRPDRSPLPTFVIESGWSESWPRLLADKNLWLAGGPTVEAVLLIRWTKVAGNHIKGDLQLYGRDAARNIALIQAEVSWLQPSLPSERKHSNISILSLSFPLHQRVRAKVFRLPWDRYLVLASHWAKILETHTASPLKIFVQKLTTLSETWALRQHHDLRTGSVLISKSQSIVERGLVVCDACNSYSQNLLEVCCSAQKTAGRQKERIVAIQSYPTDELTAYLSSLGVWSSQYKDRAGCIFYTISFLDISELRYIPTRLHIAYAIYNF